MLEESGWPSSRLCRLTPDRDLAPIATEAGWGSRLVWTGTENLPSAPGYELRPVQSVAGRYTNYAIPPATPLTTIGKVKQKERCKRGNVRKT